VEINSIQIGQLKCTFPFPKVKSRKITFEKKSDRIIYDCYEGVKLIDWIQQF